MNLCDLNINETSIIKQINIDGIKKIRLYDLGFIKGEKVKKVFSSIFDNPKCYLIKNNYIAIRDEDACNIEVESE